MGEEPVVGPTGSVPGARPDSKQIEDVWGEHEERVSYVQRMRRALTRLIMAAWNGIAHR